VEDISLPIPEELIEALARRVAQIVLAEMEADLRPSHGRWLRAKDAAEYLGWTRSALYGRVHSQSIPHYKVENMLLFKRDELDRWLEGHRVEPVRGYDYGEPHARSRAPRSSSPPGKSGASDGRLGKLPEKPARKRRERPLPPPLSGTEEQRDRWAFELEITRAELEEMSPSDFNKAWEARNERLEAAGVFEHLTELEEKCGQEMWSMRPSELIEAVRELRPHPDA
jgi:excisionase family DNA binding protein